MARFYTTTEAAAILGLSATRVRLLCQQGRIRVSRVGKNAAISAEALEKFRQVPRPRGRPAKASRSAQT